MATVLQFETWVFLGALGAIVFFRLLTGGIHTAGLLRDKETGELSPVRVQLLLFSVVGALAYLALALAPAAEAAPHGLPDSPQVLLAVVGGSNLVYLLGKSYSKFFRNLTGARGRSG